MQTYTLTLTRSDLELLFDALDLMEVSLLCLLDEQYVADRERTLSHLCVLGSEIQGTIDRVRQWRKLAKRIDGMLYPKEATQ